MFDIDTYCLFGNPVAHSKSPAIHQRFAELTGQRLRYEKTAVPLGGFAAAVAEFRAQGGKGCNITVPFKLEVAALATTVSERARLAGACNVMHFDGNTVLADNSDGAGLMRDITVGAGFDVAGRDVLLVGAGGAGAGVLGPLLNLRPRRVQLANRTRQRAVDLVATHAEYAQRHGVELAASGLDDVPPGSFQLVINATASSLAGAGVPVPARVLRAGGLGVDLMYGPSAQGFMDWAQSCGASARDGLGMLVEQAAEAFRIWRGVLPPTEVVLAEMRKA